jgi:hypothetical protein
MSGTLDLAYAQEIVEGTVDLKRGGMGGTGIEGVNVDGGGGFYDDAQEVLSEKTTMEGVRAVSDEIPGL